MNEVVILGVVLASACVVLVGVAGLDGRSRKEQIGVALGCVVVYAIILLTRPAALVLSDAAVLVVAIGLAPLLGRSLGSTGAIVAFAITASAVDLISFGGGLTREIIQGYQTGASDLLQYLAVTVSQDGVARPLVGVVDLLLVGALFLGLLRVHGGHLRAGIVLLVGLASAVVTGLSVGGVAAIPFVGFAAAADAALSRRGRRIPDEPEPCA